VPFALDLDGVIWLADQPLPGAADAVARLRDAGETVVFCTNNSSQPVGEVEAKLGRLGIPATGDVVTSAMAAAALVAPGERVLACAGPGVVEALQRRGAVVVANGDADAVVVGFHLDFDYGRLAAACTAVRHGARLLATNDDPTDPPPVGLTPGGGAILAAGERGAVDPARVAGKPHAPMAELVRARLGEGGVVVGDRVDTDGAFAATLGYRFALVLTGVAGPEDTASAGADLVAPDLAAVVAALVDC
jgi:4-nitrophenyl phosphatase